MNYSRPVSQNRPWSPPVTSKASGRTTVAPTTLESAAKDYRDLLVAVSQKRQILAGGQWASVAYQVLDGRVLRTAVMTKISPVHYTWHNRRCDYDAPQITIQSGFATEAELLAVRAVAKPAQVGPLDALLKLVREGVTPAAPLRVEITNPEALQKDTLLTIKRGDDGKMTGAAAIKVP